MLLEGKTTSHQQEHEVNLVFAQSDVTKALLCLNSYLQNSQKDCAKIITHPKHNLTQIDRNADEYM